MRFVIVTGMSGAGKSSVLKYLEDMEYFCVDNLPVALVEKFADLSRDNNLTYDKVAVGIDIRNGKALNEFNEVLTHLRDDKFQYEILFLDASDRSLVKRFKETRREHPLARGGNIAGGIKEERSRIDFLKHLADYTIDTTGLLTRELKVEIEKIFLANVNYSNMIVTVESFGFKFGIPQDADFVFDVRFLPNPYYDAELKLKTGNDKEVRDYVMASKTSEEYVEKLYEMLKFAIPEFITEEGRHHLVVAVGCTGGRHRSVTIANLLYEKLFLLPYSCRVFHRDVVNDAYVKGEQ